MKNPKQVTNLWSQEQLGLKDLAEAKSMVSKKNKKETWIGETSAASSSSEATVSA